MKGKPPDELVRQLTYNPYSTTDLVAYGIPDIPKSIPQSGSPGRGEVFNFGFALLQLIQSVLNYWTPKRIEDQALARAGDEPVPSVIAEEVTLFTLAYQKWSRMILDWAPNARGQSEAERALLVLNAIWETIMALERRAATAEARATDLRMRYQLDQLTSAVTQQKLATKIEELLLEAAGKQGEALQQLVSLREKEIQPMLDTLTKLNADANYTADKVMEKWASEKLLTTEQRIAKGTVEAVGKATLSVGLKAIIGKLAAWIGFIGTT